MVSTVKIERAAKAIKETLKRTNGKAGPWSLAMAAVLAADGRREASVLSDGVIKSMLKVKRYRASNKKGWDTRRKRLAAARAEAERQEKIGEAA